MHVNFGAISKIYLPIDEKVFLKNKYLLTPEQEKATLLRQKEYIAGRLCAQKAAAEIGIEINKIKIGKNREPLWPAGIVGSISHSRKMAVAIVDKLSSSLSLGIDAEEIISPKKMKVIERMVATKSDLKLLKNTYHSLECYTLLFSAKEALFKLIYPSAKVYFGFQEANLLSIDFESQIFELELVSKQAKLKKFEGIYKGRFYLEEEQVISLLRIPAPATY